MPTSITGAGIIGISVKPYVTPRPGSSKGWQTGNMKAGGRRVGGCSQDSLAKDDVAYVSSEAGLTLRVEASICTEDARRA